jgi:hypothetical protein
MRGSGCRTDSTTPTTDHRTKSSDKIWLWSDLHGVSSRLSSSEEAIRNFGHATGQE